MFYKKKIYNGKFNINAFQHWTEELHCMTTIICLQISTNQKIQFFNEQQWLIQLQPWPNQTVADCQDRCRLSRPLQTIKTDAYCPDNFRLSGELQTVKTTWKSCRLSKQLETVSDPGNHDCSCLLSLDGQWGSHILNAWRQDHCSPFRQKPWYVWNGPNRG